MVGAETEIGEIGKLLVVAAMLSILSSFLGRWRLIHHITEVPYTRIGITNV
jgi:hypothetical protein